MTVPTGSVSETLKTLLKLAVARLPLWRFTQPVGKFAQTKQMEGSASVLTCKR